jgi:heptosyltransferase-3
MTRLELPERPRILVVALRRLGDVLFATPLIAAIRQAWPQAAIDALVFDDTAGILAGNPDLDAVMVMPAKPTLSQGFALALRLARRYDLAVSTQSGDRPTAFALIAGRQHVGPVDRGRRGALRRLALTRSVAPQPGLHRLDEMHRIADALGIARVGHLVCPRVSAPCERRTNAFDDGGRSPSLLAGEGRGEGLLHPLPQEKREPNRRQCEARNAAAPGSPYAVVHAAPKFVYKRWTPQGWRAVAAGLAERGLTVIASGGGDGEERAFLDEVWDGKDVTRLDGQLTWPQIAALLAGAEVYVGPDTSVTHVAAASGCPTVALYGPTDPRLWGPVPAGGLDPMWEAAGTIQRRGNVWLVQNPLPCLPCQNEGCERHLLSHSRCLDELSPEPVLRAVGAALASRHAPAQPALMEEARIGSAH